MTDDEPPSPEPTYVIAMTGICDGCGSLADLTPYTDEDGQTFLLSEWCR